MSFTAPQQRKTEVPSDQCDLAHSILASPRKRARQDAPTAPFAPPSHLALSISALVWKGSPKVVEKYDWSHDTWGRYIAGPESVALESPIWNAQRGCFVYTLRTPYVFEYKRARYLGLDIPGEVFDDPDEYVRSEECVVGEGDDASPLLFLHKTDNSKSYVATIVDYNEWSEDQRVVEHPPFKFCTWPLQKPWQTFAAHSAPFLRINEPDVELHEEAIAQSGDGDESEPEERKPEGPNHYSMAADDGFDAVYEEYKARYTKVGWHGDWTREFIRRAWAKEDLGYLDYVQWDEKKQWGAKVKLELVRKSVRAEYEDGKQRLKRYKIKATVSKVYIKPQFLVSGQF
ncbi:hypothetical protein PsYK624_001670 [Phanerochaete sordida]|uniref:Uncharacterized protein n=1 Tax=Phanerochaete sordida TaxID=48140 RepID=A0A9P3FX12_9APHY|nr:hypothetical protein PsYK624_001670 [Phanerochaete sordida]